MAVPIALALVLGVTSAVAAVPPTREPLELPPSLEFAPGDVCPFGVGVEFLVNREKLMTFYDPSGEPVRQITTGSLVVRLTNLADPEHVVTLNISGPAHQTFHADGSSTLVYGGRSISLYPAGTFVLTHGRAIVEFDPAGDVLSVTNIGWEGDVCAMLS